MIRLAGAGGRAGGPVGVGTPALPTADEGRRDGGRRGHAPAAADVEPAEADGPIVGKPCMEHILERCASTALTDVVVTVAFLPQAIRSYFGDGVQLGLNIEYSVEESPLGTAGSVQLAKGRLTRRSSSSRATRSATST